jgi:hypothetical protein
MKPAGQDPETRLAFGAVTVPLCSHTKASPFWIMLLLVSGRLGHAMIAAGLCDERLRNELGWAHSGGDADFCSWHYASIR